MSVMMFLRKLPALIVLPIMACAISLLGGVSIWDTMQFVVGQGALKLSSAYTIAIFGSMLSVYLQKTGVAENFIKRGAELAGDNPWIIGVLMLILIIILFSILGGLGAIIMVATIVLPIMSSVGLSAMTTVGIFLLGLSIGGIMNVGNWAVYINVMGLTIEQVRPFALIMFAISFIAALVYITVQLYMDGHDLKLKKIFFRISIIILSALSIYKAYSFLPGNFQIAIMKFIYFINEFLFYSIAGAILLLFAIAIFRLISGKSEHSNEVHWITFFAPVIPLLLILIFSIDFITSFIAGLLFSFLATYKKGRLNLFIQSMFEGGGMVMPVVVLMFGIGMLLVAITGPGVKLATYPNGWPVLALLKPVMMHMVPTTALGYVITFTVFAPLALYRGPLNVWGMGYGIAAVFLAAGLSPGAVMGLLLAVGQIQGVSDPTNTHNVWLANEMQVDVQKILWNTLPYTWILASLGLIISALLFM